jgi:hypothetical protein
VSLSISRLLSVLVVIAVGLGAFFVGRASVDSSTATPDGRYTAGYLAGREDAFSGYDGGWGYGEPYIVVLRRAGPRITYEFAERWPMLGGVEYRACGRRVCSRPAR